MTVLVPCPGCQRVCKADEGHHLCRACEGYEPRPDQDRPAVEEMADEFADLINDTRSGYYQDVDTRAAALACANYITRSRQEEPT